MINIHRHKAVLTIEIDRPEKKNALIPQMYLDMAKALESVNNSEVRAVLIKGKNGYFTAGNDISDFMARGHKREVNETFRFMQALLKCPIPVVAQVEGVAIGIGTTLLLHCDFVYCEENAKFAMPFINLGLVPEFASSYLLPRIAGNMQAAELLLLGETFSAKKAFKCGIVSSIESADTLNKVVSETLAKLVAKPKNALMHSKALLKGQTAEVEKHMLAELEVFQKAMMSEPAKEAFSAFLEKRPVNTSIYQ